MGRAKKQGGAVITVPPSKWRYSDLAAHLGVSVRTLKRYVVAGCIPQPVLQNNRGYWAGESLVAARAGLQLPGTFDYSPNAREAKRAASVARRKAAGRKRSAVLAPVHKRSRTAKQEVKPC